MDRPHRVISPVISISDRDAGMPGVLSPQVWRFTVDQLTPWRTAIVPLASPCIYSSLICRIFLRLVLFPGTLPKGRCGFLGPKINMFVCSSNNAINFLER